MPINNLFPRGVKSENTLMESLIIESIRMYGNEWYYIPRTLVAKDDVFLEDNLSKFNDSYQIEAYLDNVDNFAGQGAFMSKFGMHIEEQAQLTIARKRWEQLVNRHGSTIIPDRPCEGDLLYFPMTDGLFEIKFVEHQSPFYQLGKLNVWKLKIELFQYSSERIDTGIEEIDDFALSMSFDIMDDMEDKPDGEKRDPRQNQTFIQEGNSVINFDENNPFGQ